MFLLLLLLFVRSVKNVGCCAEFMMIQKLAFRRLGDNDDDYMYLFIAYVHGMQTVNIKQIS